MEYFADNVTMFATEVVNTDARKSLSISSTRSNRRYNAMEFSMLIGSDLQPLIDDWQYRRRRGIGIYRALNASDCQRSFQMLIGDLSIAEMLIDSDNVTAITFTGSVPVGAKVAKSDISSKKSVHLNYV